MFFLTNCGERKLKNKHANVFPDFKWMGLPKKRRILVAILRTLNLEFFDLIIL